MACPWLRKGHHGHQTTPEGDHDPRRGVQDSGSRLEDGGQSDNSDVNVRSGLAACLAKQAPLLEPRLSS